jgi:protease II
VYYLKTFPELQYEQYFRKKDGVEELVLDINKLAKGYKHFDLGIRSCMSE